MEQRLKAWGGPGFDLEVQEWPVVGETEMGNVQEAVSSKAWWRMNGTFVNRFEREFAEAHGVRDALAVSNGTHGLELIMRALDIGPGDEVIVPAFTFVSTATAVMLCGALPVPVDVDPVTYNLDPAAVERAVNGRTRAVVPVHMAGHPCDMDVLRVIADRHGLHLVEDAAHAHGAEWRGRKTGGFGTAAMFSFQQFKLMTAGEGGIVTFQDEALREKLFRLHNVGRPYGDTQYVHSGLGSNYRMSEFQAAVLLGQLSRLDAQTRRREEQAAKLDELLKPIAGIETKGRLEACTLDPHYMYMFRYDAEAFGGLPRSEFVRLLTAEGVPAYRAYPLIQQTDVFERYVRELGIDASTAFPTPVAADIAENVVWLHHRLLLSPPETLSRTAELIAHIAENAPSLQGQPG